jgi:broad specificity phosphatase PhoE
MACNSWRALNSHSYSAPRILVTLNAFREATAGATEHQQKQAKMRPYKIRLDPESQALMEQLHQPGESVNALVVRALRAIHEGGRS